MYQYINNILSIPAEVLYEDLNLCSYQNYRTLCRRGRIERTKTGKGKGNKATVGFKSLPNDWQKEVIKYLGNPYTATSGIKLSDYIKDDVEARKFFNETYRTSDGEELPEARKIEYITNAEVFNAVKTILDSTQGKRRTKANWTSVVEAVKNLPKAIYKHSLPETERRFKDKYSRYIKEGYESLIHSLYGRKNAEKISETAKRWVLARWSDRCHICTCYAQLLTEYNRIAPEMDWKPLKSEQTLINYLSSPHIEVLWYEARYGSVKTKEKYDMQQKTKLPSMRDSLWYSDGTKLNYFYLDKNGKRKTCQVYEVMDAYSEVMLGYHISDTEDYEAQFNAFKMAIQVAGHKPYEIKFDNQGSTKKLDEFLGKISRITRRTAPYNGKSKTIENAFKRLQDNYLKQDWFFTGMNITTKTIQSKANMENILANQRDLPTLDEVKDIYAQRRREWNEAPHPMDKSKSRLEVYLNSVNPASEALQVWDIIDLFWITRKAPVTCSAYGITFTEKNQKFTYIAYKEDGKPDVEWLRRNIDKKFHIKFDPSDMSEIQLMEDTPLGFRKVCMAKLKVEVQRNAQEQESADLEYIRYVQNQNKILAVQDKENLDEILREFERHPDDYGMVNPHLLGKQKSPKAMEKKKRAKVLSQDETYGQWEKGISNEEYKIDFSKIV